MAPRTIEEQFADFASRARGIPPQVTEVVPWARSKVNYYLDESNTPRHTPEWVKHSPLCHVGAAIDGTFYYGMRPDDIESITGVVVGTDGSRYDSGEQFFNEVVLRCKYRLLDMLNGWWV